jgi:hypothetical protein
MHRSESHLLLAEDARLPVCPQPRRGVDVFSYGIQAQSHNCAACQGCLFCPGSRVLLGARFNGDHADAAGQTLFKATNELPGHDPDFLLIGACF